MEREGLRGQVENLRREACVQVVVVARCRRVVAFRSINIGCLLSLL